MHRLKFIVACVLISSAILLAAPTGAIKGYLKDQSGAVVPNATVELRNEVTNVSYKTTSDDTGFFQFLDLPPGVYQVVAEATGFRKTAIRAVNVLVDQIVSLDVKLDVGQVTEVVEVSGGVTALIEPEKTSTGTNFDPKMVLNLPIANRRFNDLAILTPGASFSPSGTQAGGFAAAGSRAQSTNWQIDGVNAIDPQVNGPLNSFRIAEAVQELSVITTVPSAEFGRQSGAQVNVVTKSGTNDLHGSAFWFIRHDKLQAADFFTNKLGGTKNTLRRNQYGVAAGGPVVRDKTFFFFSWEALKQRNPTPLSATVPTAEQRATVVDPVARRIVALYPNPTTTTVPLGQANFVGNLSQSADDNTYLARIDHSLGTNDRLMGRFIWFSGTTKAAGLLPLYGNTNTPRSITASIQENHTFTPTFFAEVRLGYSQNKTYFLPEDWGVNAASILQGVPGVVDATSNALDSGLPRVNIGGMTALGAATNLPQGRTTNTYEVFLNSTKIIGRHTVKFGYAGRRDETNRFLDGNSRGSVTFSIFDEFAGSCSACGGASIINSSTIRTGDTRGHWYRYPHAFYVQDDIKVRPNLTVNLGLRWENFSGQTEKRLKGTNFIPGIGAVLDGTNQLLDLDTTKRGAAAFILRTAPITLPASGIYPDRNNFGPIFGFAWTPRFGPGPLGDGKTVIRGGIRLGYDEVFNNIPVNQTLNAPWVLTTTQTAGVTQTAKYRWNLAFDQNVPLVARTTQAPGAPAVGLVGFNGIDPNGRTSYGYNWNFGIQREIVNGASVDISYIGSAFHKLGVFIDANESSVAVNDPARRGSQSPNELFFPFRQWGGAFYGASRGDSHFSGLVIAAKLRLGRTLFMNTSYTWSHSIDNTSAFFGSDDDGAGPASGKRLDLERSNSGFDQRHRFINSFVWDLPVGKGRRFLTAAPGYVNQILGGWSVSGITNLTTGHPFTVFANTGVDFSGFNQFLDRPDIAGSGPLVLDRGNPDRFFDPAYFGKTDPNAFCPGSTSNRWSQGCAPTGRVGTSPRLAYYGPGLINVDATVSKAFPITERIKLEYRSEFFNILNHTNFSLLAANRSTNSGNFGLLSTTSEINGGLTGGPRIIQMTLRLIF
jgi:hypothetical protein